jgi:hypothetical protein
MPDYSKGQIYKITDVGQTKCYIGSTIQQLCYRMASHRANYKNYLDGKYTFVSVFSLFEEFGVENCKMVWVKDFPCNNKKELEAEEGRIQKETDCVNKKIAGRTRAQLFQEHPEKKLCSQRNIVKTIQKKSEKTAKKKEKRKVR